MRILHVVGSLEPQQGGPSVSVPSLAAAQAMEGHDVTLATQEMSTLARKTVLSSIEGVEGVTLLSLKKKPAVFDLFMRGGWSDPLVSNVRMADFLHLHGVWDPLLLRAARVARKFGVPYAVAPRGMLDPWSLRQKRIKKSIALELLVRKMLDGAAFIHALNDDERALMAPIGLKTRVEVLPNGVFPSRIRTDAEANGGPISLIGKKKYVLFLGRLHYKKGVDVLLEAFGTLRHRNVELALVLAGPNQGVDSQIDEIARRFGISERVFRVGPLYGQAKLQWMASALCFCLPSRQEGFSMAVLEAMAVGVPVVITPECHFSEVEDVGAGRVVPLDANQIADAILEFAANAERRARAGAAARTLANTKYQWPTIARHSLRLYTNPLGNGA
ncbi:glycosyltransferase [Methylocaldum sp.]|jgi:glycosyltransferase involved in cell wall biosynthesis|uniref:glycosyltransferase n=1 Tax=Methylocaldum sp. TaxID=1969727 RepID=UPI00321FBD7C